MRFSVIPGASTADDLTARFRAGASGWCDITHLSDDQLATRIRQDRIDILVDLALHTAYNRLPVFARRPAPVQLAWLGYPGATGLETMDGWISDRFLSPPEVATSPHVEPPIRLPHAWTCYQPPPASPSVSPLPALATGHITFGSFNNLTKINERVLSLWAKILAAVPGSRLVLVVKGSSQQRTLRLFATHGVSAERIEFLAYYPGNTAADGKPLPPLYLDRYHRIDIALDPFPYNGMTTTCDALWMGVPVVALIGTISLGRASFSLLSNLGLPELAAESEPDYLRVAVELAGDLPRLSSLRAALRGRMQSSPLLDATTFARDLEEAYRHAWEKWSLQAGRSVR